MQDNIHIEANILFSTVVILKKFNGNRSAEMQFTEQNQSK